MLPSLAGGGAERAVVILLRHLSRERFEPHLALLDFAGPYSSELPPDLPVHNLKVRRVRYAAPGIIRLVRGLRPRAIVSSLSELNMAVAFAAPFFPAGIRILLREDIAVTAHLAQEHRHARFWSWAYRRSYQRADRVICVADFVVHDLAEHFGIARDKLLRIYNPVESDRIRGIADDNGNPYRSPGPHFVTVGRLSKQKGMDVLLDAMALVSKSIPSASLTILGEGPLETALRAQAHWLGLSEAVHFLGFQKNPYSYVKFANASVFSSRAEGLPLAVLESLALGTPVIAVDCPGGVREAFVRCTKSRLLPALNAPLLAEAMISACDSAKSARLSAEEAKQAVDPFEAGKIVAEYEDLLSA
ncbi:MAG TPA: glycosyltransferase [Terriglobia bacterium]|nr:glycosyltransferase [Terriglobia bacterium]